jgi:predicted enzyme related to lactoylglutathione lyase
MLHPIGLVLDCHDPHALAGFWSEALGYACLGEAGSYVLLLDPEDRGPKLLLQGVPEAKAVKNRMHLDIDAVDIEAEAARLETLGAQRVESQPMHEHGTNWILMADPEGNEFCVCDGGQSQPG